MKRKIVSWLLLTTLLVCALTLVSAVKLLRASGTIYIRADGSVEGTDKIQRDGSIYTFIDDIYDEIVVERDDIVVDGADYTLQGNFSFGTGGGYGIYLFERSNVTIKNMEISGFNTGIFLLSSGCTISRNNITGNNYDGIRLDDSSNNTIFGNNITANTLNGIFIAGSGNSVIGNNITANKDGIDLGITSNNVIYHNNFVDNINNVHVSTHPSPANFWDNGYPSGGNYWSDYADVDDFWGESQDLHGSDMIGDVAYMIDDDNQDRYPLMEPYPISNFWTFEGYLVTVISDSVITDFSFEQRLGEINFNVTADTADSCKVIISKWMLDGAFNLLVDDVVPAWSMGWSSEYHMINFTYSSGIHSVKIVGEFMLRFDLNRDGTINILDLANVAKYFGETVD